MHATRGPSTSGPKPIETHLILPNEIVQIMTSSLPRITRLREGLRVPLALAGLLAIVGCGNLTAGGLSETDVTVSGDAPDPALAAALSGPLLQTEDGDAEGELEADFLLYLENAAGSLVSLTDAEVQVRVDVRGVREEGAAQKVIPSGRYTALHIHFSNIEVEVEAGLIVNGSEVTGLVDVDFEAEDLRVVRPVQLDLGDGDRVELLIDLNSQDWLYQVDPDLQTVAEQFVADAIAVRVR